MTRYKVDYEEVIYRTAWVEADDVALAIQALEEGDTEDDYETDSGVRNIYVFDPETVDE